MRKSITILVLLLCLSFSNTANAQEPFIGEIKMFGGNFAPRGFAFCDGQLLSISQNTALFAILGTTYGGDGRTTFGLPDLRGRVPVHAGTGPGLSSYRIGQKGGTETTTITVANLPAHSHPYAAPAVSEDGNTSVPTGAVPGGTKVLDKEYSTEAPNTTMKSGAVGNTGGNQAIDNVQPYGTINYIIALVGIFPSRS